MSGDGLSRIDLDLLDAHITSGRRSADACRDRLEAARLARERVVEACPDGFYDGTGLELLGRVLDDHWTPNHDAAAVVHETLSGTGSGVVGFRDSVVLNALRLARLGEAGGVVDVELGERVGYEPLSGFGDDPVSMATGNFVHTERDLITGGVAGVIDIRRTYNSRAATGGVFGRGWTSLLDMVVVPAGGMIWVCLDDGSTVALLTSDDADGGFVADRRRQLQLASTTDGYLLCQGTGRWFTFDHGGALTGGGEGAAVFRVERPANGGAVRLVEVGSGRWVRAELDVRGLVSLLVTSDGRRVNYRYDEGGHCV